MLDFFSRIFDLFEPSCIYVRVAAATAEIDLIGELALVSVRNRAVNMLERHLRDVLCARVHTPQADVVLGLSGRLSLGLGATAP